MMPGIPLFIKKQKRYFAKPTLLGCEALLRLERGLSVLLFSQVRQGCSQCADLRRTITARDRRELWEIQKRLELSGGMQKEAWASRSGILQMTHLIGAEVQRIMNGDDPYSERKVCFINLKTLKSSWHRFLPVPLCQVCSQLPDDSPAMAQISLQQSPKVTSDSYRSRSLDDLNNVLIEDYLDQRTGLLNDKMVNLVHTFADVSVNLPLFEGDEGTAGTD